MSGLDGSWRRTAHFDRPELIGARWWHERLATPTDGATRRQAMAIFAMTGAGVIGLGILGAAASAPTSAHFDSLPSRPARRWKDIDFPGACGIDAAGLTVQKGSVSGLTDVLRPAQSSLVPYFVPTLLQTPDMSTNGELLAVLGPIFTANMAVAYAKGDSVRGLFDDTPHDTAIVIDCPGPESVAFGAALVARFEPVFVFDNVPHPEGLVPSHLTLAALVYYKPTFASARNGPSRAPAFVLDRSRAAPYRSDPNVFDNRYQARLPNATSLASLGIKHVLCVVPEGSDLKESDDLTETFVAWHEAGIDIKMLPLTDLTPESGDPAPIVPRPAAPSTPVYHFGGQTNGSSGFWLNYGWHRAPATTGHFSSYGLSSGWTYIPTRRTIVVVTPPPPPPYYAPSPPYSSPSPSYSSPTYSGRSWSSGSSSSTSGGSSGRGSSFSGG